MLRSLKRTLVYLKWIGIANDLTVAELDDPVCVFLRKLGVVRDHNDEAILRHLLEKLHDLNARFTVKCARRFVCKKNIGVVDKRTRDRNSLHLTARHLVRFLVKLIAETDGFKCFFSSFASFLASDARNGQRKLNVREDGLMGD